MAQRNVCVTMCDGAGTVSELMLMEYSWHSKDSSEVISKSLFDIYHMQISVVRV